MLCLEDIERGLQERKIRFSAFEQDLLAAEERWADVLSGLREKGFAVLKGFMQRETALGISAAFDEFCRTGKHLQLPRDVTQVKDPMDWQDMVRLTKEDVAKGDAWLRQKTNILQLEEPLLLFPELAKMGLDDALLDIAGAYLGALPSMGFVKVRKSMVNNLPRSDTQIYHIDGNSLRMMKAFLCLNDIDLGTGPHEFVVGSHMKTGDFDINGRWTYDQMVEMYGRENIQRHIGQAGDVIVEDTTGFHCAGQPETRDRNLVIFNYVLHPEFGYEATKRDTVKISRDTWNALSPKGKAASEYLGIVD